MRALLEISVCWKADQPRGIRLTLDRNFGNLDAILQSLAQRYEHLYADAVRHSRVAELVTELHVQLEALSPMHSVESLPIENILTALGHIWLLDHYGLIDSDESNGLALEFED